MEKDKLIKTLEDKYNWFLSTENLLLIDNIVDIMSKNNFIQNKTYIVEQNNNQLRYEFDRLKNIGDCLLIPKKLVKTHTRVSVRNGFNVSKFKQRYIEAKISTKIIDEGILVTLKNM